MVEKFICPKCNTNWVKNEHYNATLQNQNLINLMMGNKQLVDYCGKCNHFVYETEKEG